MQIFNFLWTKNQFSPEQSKTQELKFGIKFAFIIYHKIIFIDNCRNLTVFNNFFYHYFGSFHFFNPLTKGGKEEL